MSREQCRCEDRNLTVLCTDCPKRAGEVIERDGFGPKTPLRWPRTEAAKWAELQAAFADGGAEWSDAAMLSVVLGTPELAPDGVLPVGCAHGAFSFCAACNAEAVQRAAGMVASDATEQSLGLYVEQAEAIRELLDASAPHTTGNLQARVAQVLADCLRYRRLGALVEYGEYGVCRDTKERDHFGPVGQEFADDGAELDAWLDDPETVDSAEGWVRAKALHDAQRGVSR